jgi:hypothetical protein
VRARTGLVTPAPGGPHVEQVGWGVARQVARVLREQGVDDPDGVLDRLPHVAETPGFLAYAVFEGRTATAAAIVLLEDDAGVAVLLGEVATERAGPDVREAIVVRALHDVANAGVPGWRCPVPRSTCARWASSDGLASPS